MAQSSPEGIVLGKGSTLVKMELSVSEKQQTDILEMGQITEKEETIQDIASEYHSVAYGKLIKELTDGETTADYIDRHIVQAMVDIAKEQQDNKMYSKEEVLEILNEFSVACYSPIEKFEIPEWFEQKFKKK
jgi:hypothetical protein